LNIKFRNKGYLAWFFLTSNKRALSALRVSVSRFLRKGTASFLSYRMRSASRVDTHGI